MDLQRLKNEAVLGSQMVRGQVQETTDAMKENRKDARINKQAEAQSKLISQRKGEAQPFEPGLMDLLTNQ
jgi:hypothetical protein